MNFDEEVSRRIDWLKQKFAETWPKSKPFNPDRPWDIGNYHIEDHLQPIHEWDLEDYIIKVPGVWCDSEGGEYTMDSGDGSSMTKAELRLCDYCGDRVRWPLTECPGCGSTEFTMMEIK